MKQALMMLGVSLLMGCASTTPSPYASLEGDGFDTGQAQAISNDILAFLQDHYGPGLTGFILLHPEKPLGRALEDSLRQAGYAVLTTDDSAQGDYLIYRADQTGKDQAFVQVSVGDDYQFNRLYSLKEQVSPIGSYTFVGNIPGQLETNMKAASYTPDAEAQGQMVAAASELEGETAPAAADESDGAASEDAGAVEITAIDPDQVEETATEEPEAEPVQVVRYQWFEGETLREALQRWVADAGMNKVVWFVKDRDGDVIEIPIASDYTFPQESLEQVLTTVKRAYATAEINPLPLNFIIKGGNGTLIVTNTGVNQ